MTCTHWENTIFLHAHGQVEGAACSLVQGHLQACGTCRSRWARWVVEREALRRSFGPAFDLDSRTNGVMERVAARVRLEPHEPPVPTRAALLLRKLVLGMVTVLLAVAVSAFAAFVIPAGGWRLGAPNASAADPAPSIDMMPAVEAPPGTVDLGAVAPADMAPKEAACTCTCSGCVVAHAAGKAH